MATAPITPPNVDSPLANGGAPTTPAAPPQVPAAPAQADSTPQFSANEVATGKPDNEAPLPPEHRWLGVVTGVLQHLEGAAKGLVVGGVPGAVAGAVDPNRPQKALDLMKQNAQADLTEKQSHAQFTSAQAAATWAEIAVRQHQLDQAPKAFQEQVREKDQEQVEKLIAAGRSPAMVLPDDKPETLDAMKSELARANNGQLPGITLFHYGNGYAAYTSDSLASGSLLSEVNTVNKITGTPQVTPQQFNMLPRTQQSKLVTEALQLFSHPTSVRGEGPQQTIARYQSYLAKAQSLPDTDPQKPELVSQAKDAVDMLKSGHAADLADKLKLAVEAAKARGFAINETRIIKAVDPGDGVAKFVPAGMAYKNGWVDTSEIGKIETEYIKPAADFEKNYQMFEEAYRDYKTGTKTGAASMVATGMHIATSLGGVKGARVGPEIIAEHVGARSVPDKFAVYVNKLANGDVLSANQWNEFRQLISTARRLGWSNAVSQADGIGVNIRNRVPQQLGGRATDINSPITPRAENSPVNSQPATNTPNSVTPNGGNFFSQYGGKPRG